MADDASLLLNRVLAAAAKKKAESIHLTVGTPPVLRVNTQLAELAGEAVLTEEIISAILERLLSERQRQILVKDKQILVVNILDDRRLRVGAYRQRGMTAVTLKIVGLVPALLTLGLPKGVLKFSEFSHGLVIIAGPFSAGKSTTAAAIIEEINKTRKENIVTIEKPIENLFVNDRSLITQREVGVDAASFSKALKYCRQEDVDVIMVGETADPEVAPLLLGFAAVERLVVWQMDAVSSIQVLRRIIAQYPADRRQRALNILAASLAGIIVQRLVPRIGGGLVLATEVLIANSAVRTTIKEDRLGQLASIIQTSKEEGMQDLDQSLLNLVRLGDVRIEDATEAAVDKDNFQALIK
ncbi:hypothetical protein CL634_07100 [bacterium]|nr:hypothetical protein [bacterium]